MTDEEKQWLGLWQEFIEEIDQWSRSYPATIFPDFDMRNTREGMFSRDEAINLAASNAAGMARHVLKQIQKRADYLDELIPWKLENEE